MQQLQWCIVVICLNRDKGVELNWLIGNDNNNLSEGLGIVSLIGLRLVCYLCESLLA